MLQKAHFEQKGLHFNLNPKHKNQSNCLWVLQHHGFHRPKLKQL